ncbi:hypothetical protein MBLNU459_g3201t1 [Dothideomycetes sp. NU459]
MLVPRSFKYSTSPSNDQGKSNEQRQRPGKLLNQAARSDPMFVSRPRRMTPPQSPLPTPAPTLNSTMPVTPRPSQPVEIPVRRSSRESITPPPMNHRMHHAAARKSRRPEDSDHRADALPPAVAALLAVTAIPPPRAIQFRRKKSNSYKSRRISIDELVQEWRNDSSLRTNFGSSTSMDMLLEAADDSGDDFGSRSDGGDERLFASRSTSCDSIPSLEADDDRSVMSLGSPATPESLHSTRSGNATPRKEKAVSPLETEDCGLDHPLGTSDAYFDDLEYNVTPSPTPKNGSQPKTSSFKSNLTSSLQALKSRALASFSSLNLSSGDAFSDDTLWQHPYLFPRFSHEIRPIDFSSSPTRSERRYLNPHPSTPITLEEQQHHWQHAFPSSFEDFSSSPMIQMQTYKRTSSRKSSRRTSSGSPDPRSEAGRAMSGSPPVLSRQREPRENSDFLRVVVLEMNMRREGKLEERAAGRARIWLPPRRTASSRDVESDEEDLAEKPVGRRVPRRWVGVTLDE